MKKKAYLFHAGRGLWEVRQNRRGMLPKGIGYFYPKKEAISLMKKINKR